MTQIVSIGDLAAFLQVDMATVDAYQFHVDLVQEAVVGEVGDRAVWPGTVKALVLDVLSRIYYNPESLRSQTQGARSSTWTKVGSYFTDDEVAQIRRAVSADPAETNGPRGAFPTALGWPDQALPRRIGWPR